MQRAIVSRNSMTRDGISHKDTAITSEKATSFEQTMSPAKWLSSFMVGIYFLSFWNPPSIPMPKISWHVALALALFSYIIEKQQLDAKASRPFWSVYSISLLGAILSILRASQIENILWNTVGAGINFVVYLAFLPSLTQKHTRQILLAILIGTALLWTFEIKDLADTYGTLAYSTFAETENNKNQIGFNLAMGATAVFYLAAFWKPVKSTSKWQSFSFKILLSIVGLYLVYNASLIYARSGLLTACVGLITVLFVVYKKNPRSWRTLFQIGFIVSIITTTISTFLPNVLETSPQWQLMYERMINNPEDAFYSRDLLVRKGIYLINENPILGVGIGGSRYAVSIFPGYLIHNSYITDWAERGLLAVVSYLVWFTFYFQFVRKSFFRLILIDQLWLVLFMPLFFAMGFKDMTSVNMTMLTIFSGVYYEQYQANLARTVTANKLRG